MKSPAPPQLSLLDLPAPSKLCPLCGLKTFWRRCRICDKGEVPRPGTRTWKKWAGGLMDTLRRRLEAAGLSKIALTACAAMVSGDGEIPAEARPFAVDLTRRPITVAAYWALADRLVFHAQMRGILHKLGRLEGLDMRQADDLAHVYVDAYLAEKAAKALRAQLAEVPTRIAVIPMRFEEVEALIDEQETVPLHRLLSVTRA